MGRRQPRPHVLAWQPAMAYGQLLQVSAGARVAALCAHDSAGRRPYRVRRPARCLRCAPDELKGRLKGLVAEHALGYSRARTGFTNFTEAERNNLPPVPQVMVRTIPENGRKSLYIASHIGRIIGMPDDEACALVDQLVAHATQRQFVYTHRWRVHDLVMWDDRCTLHRGTDFDDLRWTREMHRATVSDVANTCEQEGVVARPA